MKPTPMLPMLRANLIAAAAGKMPRLGARPPRQQAGNGSLPFTQTR
jgi:hypothetical protein